MARDAFLTELMASGQRARRRQLWSVTSFAIVLPIGQVLAEAALVIGLLAWGAQILLKSRPLKLPKTPLNVLLLLWVLVAACSLQNTIDLKASLHGFHKLAKWFALYWLVVDTVDSRESLRRVLAGCLIGLSLTVLDGFWQAAFHRDLFYGNPPHVFGTARRISASFGHPADLANYLISICPLAYAVGLRGERRWRIPAAGLAGLTTVMVLLSLTRGGILGFLGSMMVLSCWVRHWLPAGFAALTAALQAATVPPSVKAWAETMPTLLEKLTQPERLMYWQAALRMIRAHPVVGIGINTFVKAYPSYRLARDSYTQLGPYAHNQYLQLTAELGLAGFAIFCALLVQVGVALRRRVAHRVADSRILSIEALASAGCGAGLVGYLIQGGLESLLFYGRGSMIFWFLVGMIMAIAALDPSTPPAAQGFHARPSARPGVAKR